MALAPCMQWNVVPCPRSSDRSWKGVVFISHVRREGVAMRGDGFHALQVRNTFRPPDRD